MNYKTTLVVVAIAATAFVALGSAFPILETAFAQNIGNQGNCGGATLNNSSDACRNSQNQGGTANTQNNGPTTFN
jgi:hypothetical protein